ncbi:MAG: ribbon-helix-helix protein, CopG family [Nitrososphaeria archaeon]
MNYLSSQRETSVPAIFKNNLASKNIIMRKLVTRKRIVSFRIERKAIELIDLKSKNRSLVMRDAINHLINEGITKDDILAVALSIPVDEKKQTSVKIDERMLDKLKRIAEENDVHVSELIRIAIWKLLMKDHERRGCR